MKNLLVVVVLLACWYMGSAAAVLPLHQQADDDAEQRLLRAIAAGATDYVGMLEGVGVLAVLVGLVFYILRFLKMA